MDRTLHQLGVASAWLGVGVVFLILNKEAGDGGCEEYCALPKEDNVGLSFHASVSNFE